MATPTLRLLLLLMALPVAACSDRQPDPASPDGAPSRETAAANQSEAEAERTMESDAKVMALTNQVDRLEQAVADVQSGAVNSSTVDARITALERKVYASDPTRPATAADPAGAGSALPTEPVKPGPVLPKPAPLRHRVGAEQRSDEGVERR